MSSSDTSEMSAGPQEDSDDAEKPITDPKKIVLELLSDGSEDEADGRARKVGLYADARDGGREGAERRRGAEDARERDVRRLVHRVVAKLARDRREV